MNIKYSPEFLQQIKKLNIRIYKSFKKQIIIFQRNSNDPLLRNHELHGEWKGYRSINITSDWRALYEELNEEGKKIAYFSFVGTHKDLYGW